MGKNYLNQDRRGIWTRLVIIGLLWLSAILDFITFVVSPKFWVFDMSPLVVLTKSIIIITLVKFGIIGGITWILLNKRFNDYFKFLYLLCAVYLILFQFVGAFNNKQVADINPDPTTAPPPKEMARIGFNFALLYAYYPIIFAMLGFWIWKWGWEE